MSSYSPDMEDYVRRSIASGRFRSREEFASEAARVYRELDERHARLKSDIQAALDESAQGFSAPLDLEAIKQEILDETGQSGPDR